MIIDSNWSVVLWHQQLILVWNAIFKSEKNILWFGYLIGAKVFFSFWLKKTLLVRASIPLQFHFWQKCVKKTKQLGNSSCLKHNWCIKLMHMRLFRCSLPTAMSISTSEILRRKKGEKLKSPWEIMGSQWEVLWGLWGSWEVSEGSSEVNGRLKGGHGRSPGGNNK